MNDITTTPTEQQPTPQQQGIIEDAVTYEWGILTKEAHAQGMLDSAQFSPTRIGNWQGGSLSWRGEQFRRGHKRGIKTLADFQRLNPLGLPTNKTYFFFKIAVDANGIRTRTLVHEGAFSDPRPQVAQSRMTTNGTQQMGDNITTPMHPASSESRSLRETMERTIADLQREVDVVRRERDMMSEQLNRLRSENDANRDKIVSIEGERIRYQVEKESMQKASALEQQRLIDDHARELDRMEDDHAREIELVRTQAQQSAAQTLSDGITPAQRLMESLSKIIDNAPQYMGTIGTIADVINGMKGGGNKGGFMPALDAPATPSPTDATPMGTGQTANGFDQQTDMGYTQAEVYRG